MNCLFFIHIFAISIILLCYDFKYRIIIPSVPKEKEKESIIPKGDTIEEINIRKHLLWNYFQNWKKNNSSQKIFNLSLNEYINIKSVSIDETSYQASKNYLSTLAVFHLNAILTKAKKYKTVMAKANNKNQKKFNKLLWLKLDLQDIGEIKIMVGIVRRTKEKVLYSITVIRKKKKTP